jgi:hypothetical protein
MCTYLKDLLVNVKDPSAVAVGYQQDKLHQPVPLCDKWAPSRHRPRRRDRSSLCDSVTAGTCATGDSSMPFRRLGLRLGQPHMVECVVHLSV